MLPLSSGRIRLLGLVQRERRDDFSDLERLSWGKMVGNVGQDMVEVMLNGLGRSGGVWGASCWLWGFNLERLG